MTTTQFAPYGVELPAFNPDGRCPKCGHEQVTTWHSAPGCTDKECRTCDGEHLRRTCQRCRYAWAEAVADPSLGVEPVRSLPVVADPITEQMRRETGHDCITCPTRVRDLMATAHNLLTRLELNDWNKIPSKRESLRQSLAQIQLIADEHFAALEAWRRPSALTIERNAEPTKHPFEDAVLHEEDKALLYQGGAEPLIEGEPDELDRASADLLAEDPAASNCAYCSEPIRFLINEDRWQHTLGNKGHIASPAPSDQLSRGDQP